MAQSRFASRLGLNANQVRQGRLGRDVFWVLLASTVLAFVGLIAAWAWHAQSLSSTVPDKDVKAAAAQTFDTPAL